ncbi:MAG TPA: hypothetical protein VFF49_05970 [Thermodesulfobacteriota bacterium]|nr:hypothetical protein [Thermodesulfobacteriota bacterium]
MGTTSWSKIYLKQFSIPDICKQAHANEYERQIDRMVYELYDLTDKEITIVEGKEDSIKAG